MNQNSILIAYNLYHKYIIFYLNAYFYIWLISHYFISGAKEEISIKQIIYRCLICLGDLSRYIYELNKLDLYYSTACRYYKQALNYKPNYGLPHNQIGRLASSKNKHLDAVYYYIRW